MIFQYQNTGTSASSVWTKAFVGVYTSWIAHCTIKCVIEALACWNCIQSVLYTIQPGEKNEAMNA